MRINMLQLQNFKCFEDASFEFPENMTILVGANASGKTAVLDALAVAISCFSSSFDGSGSGRTIKSQDVRLQTTQIQGKTDIQYQFPASINSTGIIDGEELLWKRSLNGLKLRNTKGESKSIRDKAKVLQVSIRSGQGDSTKLPVLAYYTTKRLWAKDVKPSYRDIIKSRFDGYLNCMEANAHMSNIIDWLREESYAAIQDGEPSTEFTVVKKAMESCVAQGYNEAYPNAKVSVDYHIKRSQLEISVSVGDTISIIPFEQLSDGYKNVLGLVSDIAWRGAILNPYIGSDLLNQLDGIVLIDEIDLHLHPRWQSHIISDLQTLFPKIQFVVSTHSPNILKTAGDKTILLLDQPLDKQSSEPKALSDFKWEQKNNNLAHTLINKESYNVPSEVQQKIKESLMAEQHGICCYCMRKLTYDSMRVEHFLPQSSHHGLKYEYNNLLAACEGKIMGEQCCDVSKDSIIIDRSPLNDSHMSSVSYDSKGQIKTSSTTHNQEMNEILNLNCKAHVDNRFQTQRAMIYQMGKKYGKSGSWSKKVYNQQLHAILKSDKYPEYAGIMIFYLQKKLKKAVVSPL